jgi:hypothetical protein
MTWADMDLIDSHIYSELLKRESASFNTLDSVADPDEFDLDGAVAFYAGVNSDAAFRASTVSASAHTADEPPALVEDSDDSDDDDDDAPAASPLLQSRRVTKDDLRPIATAKGLELTLSQALPRMSYEKLVRTTAVEISKQQRIGCIGTQTYTASQLPQHKITVRAHLIYKDKSDGRETCRTAAMGNLQPRDPTVLTSSAVASDDDKAFSLALMQAYCCERNEPMLTIDVDIVGGFLRIQRVSDTRMFLFFPPNTPHPYAGLYVEVFGALYGLYESNRLFSNEVRRVLLAAGFIADPRSPMTYTKVANEKKVVVTVHVDDFRGAGNHMPFLQDLHDALVARFEEVTTHSPSTSYTGLELIQHPNGACETLQTKYIERVAERVGIVHLPPVLVPCDSDIFKMSHLPADCVPVPTREYCALTGYLIQMMKTRDEIRPYVSTLCSRNSSPNAGDFNKAIQLLRYLYSTRTIGRVFYSKSTQITGFCDAAFGIHSNGCSAEAGFLSIGVSNAPFYSVAKAQSNVATCPMTAEYMSTATISRAIERFIAASESMGISQGLDLQLHVDNSTAKSLATAPEITRKSLHIHVKYHYIRELVSRRVIQLKLVRSEDMRADILTKWFPPAKFKRLRDILLNRGALLLA